MSLVLDAPKNPIVQMGGYLAPYIGVNRSDLELQLQRSKEEYNVYNLAHVFLSFGNRGDSAAERVK
jgi:hypothetical protein